MKPNTVCLAGLRCAAAWLLLAVGLVGAAPAVSAKALKIGTVAWAGFSPLNVADTQGFWKAEGLGVEVIVFSSNQEVNGALEAGRIDLALDMIGSWVGLAQSGVPLVIVGETDWSNGGDKIIARQGYDLTQLKGSRVGVYLDQPSVTFFLHRFLQSKQLTITDVEAVELAPQAMADHFIAGKLPLIVNYDPQALRAEKEGRGQVLATSATYAGVIPEGFAALAASWRAISDEDKTRLWRGWLKAVAWTKDPANWPVYQRVLNEKTFPDDADFSEAELKGMVEAVSIHNADTLAKRNRIGGDLTQYLKELHAFLKVNGRLKKEFQPAEQLDTDLLVKAAAAAR